MVLRLHAGGGRSRQREDGEGPSGIERLTRNSGEVGGGGEALRRTQREPLHTPALEQTTRGRFPAGVQRFSDLCGQAGVGTR